MIRLLCALLGHRWGPWHAVPIDEGTCQQKLCIRCPAYERETWKPWRPTA